MSGNNIKDNLGSLSKTRRGNRANKKTQAVNKSTVGKNRLGVGSGTISSGGKSGTGSETPTGSQEDPLIGGGGATFTEVPGTRTHFPEIVIYDSSGVFSFRYTPVSSSQFRDDKNNLITFHYEPPT